MHIFDALPRRPADGVLSLTPFGVPLRVDVSAADGLPALDRAFEGWAIEGGSTRPAIRLRIEHRADLAGVEGARIGVRGKLVAIDGPGVSAWADPTAGLASCCISSDYLALPWRLREEVLDPLVLAMVAWRDRAPIHASAFLADGVALLLAGRSGAGKSCLATAADRAGFQILSEDTVYVQLRPRLRVWGWPRNAHLLPADAVGAAGPPRVRNGKFKQVVSFQSATRRPINADRAALCVIASGEHLSLSRIGTDAVLNRLFPLDPGFDMLPRQIRRAVRALTCRGAWELRLGADPAAAVQLLAENLPLLKQSAAP